MNISIAIFVDQFGGGTFQHFAFFTRLSFVQSNHEEMTRVSLHGHRRVLLQSNVRQS